MKKIISIFLAILISFTVPLSISAEEYNLSQPEKAEALSTALDLIKIFGITDKSTEKIERNALLKLGEESNEAFYKVLNAVAQSVDEYSYYYSPEEWEELYGNLSATIGGIGVRAVTTDGYFEVVEVLKEGSAIEVGIEKGDKIVEADGVDITGIKANVATDYITGEVGTFVNIKVQKKDGTYKEFLLERREITVPSMGETVLEDNIGYVYIDSFTEKTAQELSQILESYKEKGITKLIIDLRYNGGGVMEGGIESAALFLKKGETIISTKSNDEKAKPTFYKAEKDGFDFTPIVLVNEYTASASEIMTCALKDNKRGIIIGVNTFGKACAQSLYPLNIGGALRVTTYNYYTPNNNFISGVGIEPDIEVSNTTYRHSADEIKNLDYYTKYENGMESDGVLTVETMLYDLDYLEEEPDKVYDNKTERAVIKFQEESGLYPYGVCDITTQNYLISKYLETDFLRDDQFDYAVKYAKENL